MLEIIASAMLIQSAVLQIVLVTLLAKCRNVPMFSGGQLAMVYGHPTSLFFLRSNIPRRSTIPLWVEEEMNS